MLKAIVTRWLPRMVGWDERKYELAQLATLRVLLDSYPVGLRYIEIAQRIDYEVGYVIPALYRYEQLRWVESEWGSPPKLVWPKGVVRPRHRFYRLTDGGLTEAREELSRAS